MINKKNLVRIVAASLLSVSAEKIAAAAPTATAYVVEAPAPLQPLKPFYEYTCGDSKLPTAYYFFDIHYNRDDKSKIVDVWRQDPKDPGYERNKKAAEQYEKIADEALRCQEQIYLTMQQLQQEKKISVGFIEGVHEGDSVEEYSRLVHDVRTDTQVRKIFQNTSLGGLVDAFKTGLTAFAAIQKFPVFGWESMTQEEYDKLSEDFWGQEKDFWKYYQTYGADTTYQSWSKAQDEKIDEIGKIRSDAAYDNSLQLAQQWIKEHPDAPRGYVVNIGAAHGNDVLERFKVEGHPNAVTYVCGE